MPACEALVLRALERAGNRLKNNGIKPPNVRAFEVHCHLTNTTSQQAINLLEDAWSTADIVLDGIGDVEAVVPALTSYCTALLVEGSPHKRERLAQWLSLMEKTA